MINIVTGGTGFVGSFLINRLLSEGSPVVAVVRETPRVSAPERLFSTLSRVRIVYGLNVDYDLSLISVYPGDIEHPALALPIRVVQWLRSQPVEIWHCAASVSLSQTKSRLHRTNVTGTTNVLGLARAIGARKVHFLGTCFVSGDFRGKFTEQDYDLGQGFRNYYEETKFLAEGLIRNYQQEEDSNATIYRLGLVIGDSKCARTTNFNGFYAVGKILARIARKLRDCHRPNNKQMTSRRLLRLCVSPLTTLPTVPIDHAVNSLLAIGRTESSVGKTFHLICAPSLNVQAALKTIARAVELEDVLNVDSQPQIGGGTSLSQSFLNKLLSQYAPYLANRTTYDFSETQGHLKLGGIREPVISRGFVNRLISFAKSRNWGDRQGSFPDMDPGRVAPQYQEAEVFFS